jgi:hypothetical protein
MALAACSSSPGAPNDCATRDDCAPGFVCLEGTCLKVCTCDRDCVPSKTQACDLDDGVCREVAAPSCTSDAACVASTPPACHLAAGAECWGGRCDYPRAAPGSSCDDDLRCTEDDRCDADGVCSGTALACDEPPDECLPGDMYLGYDGTCDEDSGTCDYVALEPVACADCIQTCLQSLLLEVDYLQVLAAAAGSSDYFIITTNTSWEIASHPAWVDIDPMAGTGTTHVTVTAQENTGAERTGWIVVAGVGVPLQQLGVTQLACAVPPGDYYIAPPPAGDDDNPGTLELPFATLAQAWTVVAPGDLVYLRGGTYVQSQQRLTGKSGTAGNYIKVWAYPGEQPVITRDASFTHSYPCSAIYFVGDWVHFRGLEITGIVQIDAGICAGFRAHDSNHNIFEQFNSHGNGHGMVLAYDSTGNLVLHSDFHHNQDPLTPTPYGNADGLEVCYMDHGVSNTIRGCRFWWNTDDGIDLWQNDGQVLIEDCWSWHNGFIPDTLTTAGDGNGFKLGSTLVDNQSLVLRTVQRSLAFHNRAWGFLDNGAKCGIELYNNTAFQNGYLNANTWSGGFHFGMAGVVYDLKNNIAHDNFHNDAALSAITDASHNSWNLPLTVANGDFASVIPVGMDAPRKPDGSLPDITFMHLAPDSELIDAGTDVGLPFTGSAPDLGAFER